MADIQTPEVDTKLAPSNIKSWTAVVYASRSSKDEQLLKDHICGGGGQKYEHGAQLRTKVNILFHWGKSWAVAFTQIKFGAEKSHRLRPTQ
jgi:hypothetical protein